MFAEQIHIQYDPERPVPEWVLGLAGLGIVVAVVIVGLATWLIWRRHRKSS
jgi:hypothetical protein